MQALRSHPVIGKRNAYASPKSFVFGWLVTAKIFSLYCL